MMAVPTVELSPPPVRNGFEGGAARRENASISKYGRAGILHTIGKIPLQLK
jgi:hypothetical protein